MDRFAIANTVGSIRALVAAGGYGAQAAWLDDREKTLRDGSDADAQVAVAELRQIVHGMGSLLDVSLTSAADRRELDLLTDHLWTSIKD